MAPPLLSLRDARVTFGGTPLFEGATFGLGRGNSCALVGRNGSGKSTLLKVLAGRVEIDGGEMFVQPGLKVAYLTQEPAFAPGRSVRDHVAEGLGADAHAPHRVEAVLEGLRLDGGRALDTLSGGEGRRAALARALVGEPDVLLLDEPTNHLDLPTIEWLEGELAAFPGALMIVSHDRAFLRAVTGRTLWLDRGRLRTLDAGFEKFDEWSEGILATEEVERAKLDKRITVETDWSHKGITARRRRNEGRLRRLKEMRRQRAEMRGRTGRARMSAEAGETSGRLVIEAEAIVKRFGERVVIRDFSTRVLRGDRIGIIGPNGAGKTTLLRMLTGELPPDEGTVRLGTNVTMSYVDQRRAALDPDRTLWQTLSEGGGDSISVQGRPRHVVSYLKDFLFEERQALSPVKALSGGERNRLLLAKLLAKPSNLLVLDEPTNDLDTDTLDLLQEMLGEYEGTVLLVSHDRDFLDRVVTSIVAVEGDGTALEYAGGYSDYLAQRGKRPAAAAPTKAPPKAGATKSQPPRPPTRLSYKDQRELDELPGRIDALSREVAESEARLADPGLYARDPAGFAQTTAALEKARAGLESAEERWLELEAMREELAAAKGTAG